MNPNRKKGCELGYGPGSEGGGTGKKHDARRKPPPNMRSLARAYTAEGTRILAAIMRDENQPGMTRVAAIKILFDRGWGPPSEPAIANDTGLVKVVNEIVHVHETREEIEFNDQTPLLKLTPEEADGESKKTH